MRRLLSALALALALPLAACGDGTGPDEDIEGVYALQTVNGDTVPTLLLTVANGTVEIVSGAIRLEADGSFEDLTTYRITENGVARNEDDVYTGTFLRSERGATLNPVGFEPYQVAIAGPKMRQIIGDYELIYRK